MLYDIPGFSSVDYILSLEGVAAKPDENGSVILVNEEGETLAHIPAGYMTDAKGCRSDGVVYQLKEAEEGVILSVVLDTEWLNSENRAYPVTVDPCIILGGFGSTQITDASIMEGNPYASTVGNHMLYGRREKTTI